jgi:hypothetical protein
MNPFFQLGSRAGPVLRVQLFAEGGLLEAFQSEIVRKICDGGKSITLQSWA